MGGRLRRGAATGPAEARVGSVGCADAVGSTATACPVRVRRHHRQGRTQHDRRDQEQRRIGGRGALFVV
ncbi:hypothetical protein OIE71_18290 [Streptomyces sp. NBC_01725]|uniref:hypothetical protein n=1 Tax=Streptomyces sp. NBC_01725 TaxID=2975923 RepID=UPI002E2DE071|nr:hypothetical protein [Streptomyces sp. NBC_01725]